MIVFLEKFEKHVVSTLIVMMVIVIADAIARKVIILDFEKYDGLTIIGTAVLILAVAAACYAVKRKLMPRPD